MDDLVTWLHAQLDDDAATAAAASKGPWRAWRGQPGLGLGALEHGVVTGDQAGVAGEQARIVTVSWIDAEHIALHDPARVLREVEAKRLRLAEIESRLADDPTDETALWLLRVEVLPFADRPGYREEWRP